MLFLCRFKRYGLSLSASRRFAVSDTACCSFLTMTSEVQGERRAELARAMLSRSLHSRCISNASQRYVEYQRETIVSPDYFQLFFNKISRRVAVSPFRRAICKIDRRAVP